MNCNCRPETTVGQSYLVYWACWSLEKCQLIFTTHCAACSNVLCRSNLKQLDEITVGLRRRLLAGCEAEAEVQDSESAVPLSTSSVFVTAGSMVPTWEFQSTLHSSDHAAPRMLVSTGDSATTGDAVTELMQRTLRSTGSRSSHLAHTCPNEINHTSGNDDDDDARNLPRDCSVDLTSNVLFHDRRVEERNSEIRASAGVDCNSDPLKTAQMLLEQLNEITACTVTGDRQADSPIAADFGDEDDDMQEDDTLANIWALRQSTRHDDGDDESLDLTVLPNENDKSYISPQALNDVVPNHDEFSAASHTADDLGGHGDAGDLWVLESEIKQPSAAGGSGESGDTWFIDTQDVRDIDNMAAMAIRRRLQENVDIELQDVDEAFTVNRDPSVDVQSPGRPVSQSSPSLAQLSPAISAASYPARKSRSLRKTAVQRREQLYLDQHPDISSDSESDDPVASLRLRHRRPQNSQRAPSNDQLSASNADLQAPVSGKSSKALDDKVMDMVGHNQESQTVANQEIKNDTEDEPDSASSNIVTVRSANQDSPIRTDVVTVSDDQVLNGHHSASGDDLYPSYQQVMMMNTFQFFKIRYYLHLLPTLIVSLTEWCRSDQSCPAMPNFFLPASDLERSMKAIRDIGRQLPVAAKVCSDVCFLSLEITMI